MTDSKQTVREDVVNGIKFGQTIYDNTGARVGTVDDIDLETGWLTVKANPFSDKELYVPFNLITHIDPTELYLSRSKDELRREYANPPARGTRVERVMGESVATTREASGYDGSPIVVDEARIDELRQRITDGYLVVTLDNVDLGTIKRYDRTTGWMLVGKNAEMPNDIMIPVILVSHVDGQFAEVHLAASMADLQRMQHLEPVDVVFTEGEPKRTS